MSLLKQRRDDLQALNAQLATLDDRSRSRDLVAAYDRSHPAPETVSDDPAVEEVAWARARQWWPHGGLLQLNSGLHKGAVESTVVFSESGGTHGDPATESAGVVAYYQYRERTIRNATAREILDAGGLIFQHLHWSSDQTSSPLTARGKDQQIIVVRGEDAVMTTLAPPAANVHMTKIRWQVRSPLGTIIEWQLQCDPRFWSKAQLLEILNAAEPV